MGQYELATEYLGRLEEDLDDIRQMVESGNVSLDAILNSKLSYAEKKEISLNFKATVPQKLTVSDIDLCVLIGNLIDNAVEACEKLPVKDRFLRLYIGVFRKQLYISVTNATNELVRKLDDEYITTKRGNHGHGLKRINNTVEKYGGFINRKMNLASLQPRSCCRCNLCQDTTMQFVHENNRSCTNCVLYAILC